MTTLIETWEQRIDQLPDAEIIEAMTWAAAICGLKDACTPRKPDPSMFGAPFDADGKPTGKWDSWWCDAYGLMRNCRTKTENGVVVLYWGGDDEYPWDGAWRMDAFDALVLSVAREGYCAPVSWQVLEVLRCKYHEPDDDEIDAVRAGAATVPECTCGRKEVPR